MSFTQILCDISHPYTFEILLELVASESDAARKLIVAASIGLNYAQKAKSSNNITKSSQKETEVGIEI